MPRTRKRRKSFIYNKRYRSKRFKPKDGQLRICFDSGKLEICRVYGNRRYWEPFIHE